MRRRGFTLIELLVVISIMLIITSVLLFRQEKFNSSTLMRTLAYNIALSVREAQVYGTSVRDASIFNESLKAAYGIHFSSGATGSYSLFADINGNGTYDSGEEQETFTLRSGYTILNFCAVTNPSTYACKTGGTAGTLGSLTIYFKRPNPDARFTALDSGDTPVVGTFASAYVQIQAPNDDTRAISVTTTGQITVCSGINQAVPDC